mgnify:CR=1 FL=1
MIKLIASDLDGTLLQKGAQTVSRQAIELIEKLLDNGIHLLLPAEDSTTT